MEQDRVAMGPPEEGPPATSLLQTATSPITIDAHNLQEIVVVPSPDILAARANTLHEAIKEMVDFVRAKTAECQKVGGSTVS
uniref:Uncharacterized protein n=1 Tax=Ditylenchus dipsaci TaxID=166011 RepID=A0A915CPK0_9BILA